MKILKKLARFLFPSHCIVCKRENFWVCPKCLRDLPQAKTPEYNWIISVWNYKDPRVKKLLWKFKFENKFSVIEDLSLALYENLHDELSERALTENLHNVILVPIPISAKSRRKRGYNQSEIIAKELQNKSSGKIAVLHALKKIRETPTQHSIKNRRERLRNLHNVYCLKHGVKVYGKNIIMIDDITTTHGTLIEAKRALKQAGAKRILAFTIAH